MGLVGAALRALWIPVECAVGLAQRWMWKGLAANPPLMQLASAVRYLVTAVLPNKCINYADFKQDMP